MIIRHIEDHEFSYCLPLARAFYESRAYELGGTFSEEKFLEHWQRAYLLDTGVIIGAWDGDDLKGMIAGTLGEGPYDGILSAQECFWWFPNGGRNAVRLVTALEEWSRAKGARSLAMAHFADTPRIGNIYRHLGYKDVEHFYRKVL